MASILPIRGGPNTSRCSRSTATSPPSPAGLPTPPLSTDPRRLTSTIRERRLSCPELFVLLEDGISYVRAEGEAQNDPGGAESMAPVPAEHVDAAVAAAEDCPGECIFLEELAVDAITEAS